MVDFFKNKTHASEPVSTIIAPMVTRLQIGKLKPKKIFDLVAILNIVDSVPSCFSKANRIQEWRTTMAEEYNALVNNGTWELVPRTNALNVVGCKWVFCIKQNSDGSLDHYKAHLVAKGFHQ